MGCWSFVLLAIVAFLAVVVVVTVVACCNCRSGTLVFQSSPGKLVKA